MSGGGGHGHVHLCVCDSTVLNAEATRAHYLLVVGVLVIG